MTSSTSHNGPHPVRSYSWVNRDSFAAIPFYKRGFEILKRDPLILVWKLIADAVSRFAPPMVGLLIVALFLVDFQFFVDAGYHPLDWFERASALLRSPEFIVASVGLYFLTALLTTVITALIVAGIWGLLADGLRGKPICLWSTFSDRALVWFPDVLSLYLIRFAAGAVNALLGIALLIGCYRAFAYGVFADAPGWQTTLLVAGGIAFYIAWSGLTRLAVTVAGASLVIDDVDVGESLYRAGVFALDNFWSLYRLLIFAVGLLLVPLGLYWLFIMIGNFSVVWPAFSPVASMLRFVGELILFVGITAVGIAFYGALFAFYHCDDDNRPVGAESTGSDSEDGGPKQRTLFGVELADEKFQPDPIRNRTENFRRPPSSPIMAQ